MVNSWTIHEHSCFKKNGPFAFRLSPSVSSSPFLFLPLFSFLFLSFPLSSSLFLSFPLSSSLFLSFPPLLSFFNVHPALPANSLRTKDLRKRHFWLKILSPGKPLRLKTLGAKFAHIFFTFPPTPHSTRARNWPYMLRRETLHYVGFHVGFANPILHTQHRWLSNLKPALCRVCRECMTPLKTV